MLHVASVEQILQMMQPEMTGSRNYRAEDVCLGASSATLESDGSLGHMVQEGKNLLVKELVVQLRTAKT